MANYFRIKDYGKVKLEGGTIEVGAEKWMAKYLDVPVENVEEITLEEFESEEQCACSKYGKSLHSGIKCSNCGREL